MSDWAYKERAKEELVKAEADKSNWYASLCGACMACHITWQEQSRAIEGSRLMMDLANTR